jgi:hypothetical protein
MILPPVSAARPAAMVVEHRNHFPGVIAPNQSEMRKSVKCRTQFHTQRRVTKRVSTEAKDAAASSHQMVNVRIFKQGFK